MKCEYCDRVIEKDLVSKNIRGKRHVFCSETCYVLDFYDYPRFDMTRMYEMFTISIPVNSIRELIEDEG